MTEVDPEWYKKIWTLDIQDMSWLRKPPMRLILLKLYWCYMARNESWTWLAAMEDTDRSPTTTRLYTIEELHAIFSSRGMEIQRMYGDYDPGISASDDLLTLIVFSQKI